MTDYTKIQREIRSLDRMVDVLKGQPGNAAAAQARALRAPALSMRLMLDVCKAADSYCSRWHNVEHSTLKEVLEPITALKEHCDD